MAAKLAARGAGPSMEWGGREHGSRDGKERRMRETDTLARAGQSVTDRHGGAPLPAV